MNNIEERLTKGVSTAEMERRWKAAREVMKDRKIDFLLMRNDEEFLGGYVRWFSDFPARHSYPFTVIFPVDDEMTFISSGHYPPVDPYPPQWSVRGVKKRLAAPYFPSMHYTNNYDAELIEAVFRRLHDDRRPGAGSAEESPWQIVLEVVGGPHTGRRFEFTGHDGFIVGRDACAHFRLLFKISIWDSVASPIYAPKETADFINDEVFS